MAWGNIKNVSKWKWLPETNTTRERMKRFGSPKEIWGVGTNKPSLFLCLDFSYHYLRFQYFQTLHIKSSRSHSIQLSFQWRFFLYIFYSFNLSPFSHLNLIISYTIDKISEPNCYYYFFLPLWVTSVLTCDLTSCHSKVFYLNQGKSQAALL